MVEKTTECFDVRSDKQLKYESFVIGGEFDLLFPHNSEKIALDHFKATLRFTRIPQHQKFYIKKLLLLYGFSFSPVLASKMSCQSTNFSKKRRIYYRQNVLSSLPLTFGGYLLMSLLSIFLIFLRSKGVSLVFSLIYCRYLSALTSILIVWNSSCLLLYIQTSPEQK